MLECNKLSRGLIHFNSPINTRLYSLCYNYRLIEWFEKCNVEIVEIRSEQHRPNHNQQDRILMLNDNCFLEIFKQLSLLDLANFKNIYGSVGAVTEMAFFRSTRGLLSVVVLELRNEHKEKSSNH